MVHGARAERAEVRHLVTWVREEGCRLDVLITHGPGDARALTQGALAQGASVVVAVGGDGTVNEVASVLVGTEVPLGIVPLGTANDLARQLGIPLDPDHAMDVILRHSASRIDVGMLGDHVFVNVSAGGVGAQATAETRPRSKGALGALAYAVTGVRSLASLEPRFVRFAAHGWVWEGDILAFAVANGRTAGGGLVISPRSSLIDGMLDLCILEAMPRREFARLALRVRRGDHLGERGVHYRGVTELTVECSAALHVNVDGEPRPGRLLHYRVRKGALLVRASTVA
ncbi:MAG: lipid kinase YegS [Gemmatimonadaceae bacterium]